MLYLHYPLFLTFNEDTNGSWAVMKIDENVKKDGHEVDLAQIPAVPPRPLATPETRTISAKSRASTTFSNNAKSPATVKTFEMPLQQMPMVRILFLK